jgi:ribosomal protein S18 acetylase RimI-like enzyme
MSDWSVMAYEARNFAGVDALWRRVFPDDPPHNRADVAVPEKMRVQPDLFLVAVDGARVLGTVMAGYDGHRGWLYSVAVDPDQQRGGMGTALVRAAEAQLVAVGCRKINLQIRAGNEAVTAFYARLGYAVEPRVSMGKQMADLV